MKTLKMGIDDAGRGPVMGPMILAGVLCDEETENEFRKLGVKDSKGLTQKRREFLEEKIKEISIGFEVRISSPEEIDSSNAEGIKLNELEANKCAEIIDKINLGKDSIKVILDCPSVNLTSWGDYLKTKIKNLSNLEISCEHKADQNHLVVGAASILAKCVREREIQKLKEIYGSEIGSGYTSDPATIKFLQKFADKYKNKGIFRKTWITYKKAIQNLAQQTL